MQLWKQWTTINNNTERIMSQMYEFIKDTWNPLAGECPHKCKYCYVNSWKKRSEVHRKKYSGELRLDENAMKKSVGKGKKYFVCSMNDLFANNVPSEMIQAVIDRCNQFPDNKYLFQTKNPARIRHFTEQLQRRNFTVCVTIESDIWHDAMGEAPPPKERLEALEGMWNINAMFTIEPIMKFSKDFAEELLSYMIDGEQINIGADSKGHKLPEPTSDEVQQLIKQLKGCNVHLKDNLKRLTNINQNAEKYQP
jgi:DNA repair photolyase